MSPWRAPTRDEHNQWLESRTVILEKGRLQRRHIGLEFPGCECEPPASVREMSIAQFFSRPGGATSDTKRQKTTEEEDVPPEEPRTIVVWNANSLLSRVDSNRNELQAFIEKVSPDVLFVSEVRMPAAGPPGSKVGDGKPRTHGTLSKATAALAEEAELGFDKCRPGGATAAR